MSTSRTGSLTDVSRLQIARYLPVLLADLQKFAVAFEQVYRDEQLTYEHSPRERALEELVDTLRLVSSLYVTNNLTYEFSLLSTGKRRMSTAEDYWVIEGR